MAILPEFVQAYLSEGEALFKAGCVREPIFSRGTYQIEVQEKGKKKAFPFEQLKDDGTVSDFFCTCKISEEGKGCPHLAAAYLRIFNGTDEPLHIRFKKSFWNRLFQMESKRSGDEPSCIVKEKDGSFTCKSQTKKILFWTLPKTADAKKKLESILARKAEETEETSIKFSNLSAEEIELYRKGQASHLLRYELSFWSDIAKWLMHLQDEKEMLKIRFQGSPIPSEIEVDFPEVELKFSISEVHLPWIIPSLNTVPSPLKVFEEETDAIEKVIYDEKVKKLFIHRKTKETETKTSPEGPRVGDWTYLEGKGFYKRGAPSLFQESEISEDKIGAVLSASFKELSSFLQIHPDPIKARYSLYFDDEERLHVSLYLFEPGDMKSASSACFAPWAYLPNKGFYLVEEWLFEGNEKIVPKSFVGDFVNKHRLWLHQFPGFQTHLGSLESRLIYFLSPDGELSFDVELTFPLEDMLNFDEWIFIRGQGFYMKKESSGRLPLHPGLKIPNSEIASFISGHKEELEQVHGFFASESPILQMGLSIRLNSDHLIEINPITRYASGADAKKIRFFGDYLYLEGRGFSQIPSALSVPEKYRTAQTIPSGQEASFLAYELEPLQSYIQEIDPRIQKPSHLKLKIRKAMRDTRSRTQGWLVDVAYESEIGFTDVFGIWDAIFEKKRFLFSPAGLLTVKEVRFNWIRQLSKKRLDRKRGLIRLNTLEWARLCAFEQLEAPKGNDPSAIETRRVLTELEKFETKRLPDITGLKSSLRPYQEQGVHWLWFLYCNNLSGLLCDDMGLGKTHQAMALLAAIANDDTDKRNKYFVVCPTSVIYHWQELLKKFLPHIRVSTYYGLTRSLEDFETHYDLLLTSYGILRLGKDELGELSFEAAFFDEIQVAKNFASQTNQALRAINAKMKLGLTGTPIENRVREIKSLFDIILPSYMPSEAVFRDLFVRPIEKENDEEKRALLARLIKPFILRRKKGDVLKDLPEKIEEISYCDLSSDQKDLYNQVASQMRETVYRELKDESKPVPYLHVFSALSKMKQICDHPALIDGDIKNYQKKESGKWDLFVELLYEARESCQKVVVFSQYLDMLAIIESYLKKKGIGYASIKGSTKDRNEQLARFREDPKCEIFVASLLAAGVGIDLTVASIVIHYDRWWNPAKENQATDRVHRIGQSRGVQVFKLVTKNTIEEDIHEIIERKKGLLEQIVGTDDQINYLTREELIQVFEKMFRFSP